VLRYVGCYEERYLRTGRIARPLAAGHVFAAEGTFSLPLPGRVLYLASGGVIVLRAVVVLVGCMITSGP
jgi:hypothetical protein